MPTNPLLLGALPNLPYEDGTFDLALCSHFLFLYEAQFDYSFHLSAVKELLRVCKAGGEVHIYPFLNFQYHRYPYMDRLLEDLKNEGAITGFRASNLPFLPNSKQYFLVKKPL